MYGVQALCLHSVEIISSSLVSSIFSVHSSANLLTNLFLHLQFLQSNYSLKSQDLQHSHSLLLGFKINPLSHTFLSINSLHLHPHLSSIIPTLFIVANTTVKSIFTLTGLCHSMRLVSLVPDTRLNILTFRFFTTSGTHNFVYGLLILQQLPLHFLVLMIKGKKHRVISINNNNLWSYFTFLIVH